MNHKIVLNIDELWEDQRLDVALAELIPKLSRSRIQKLILSDNVKINHLIQNTKKEKLKEGDLIEVTIPEAEDLKIVGENIPIDVIYEDEDLLVVNKGKGMVVHPAPGNPNGTLVNALIYHCKGRLSSINGIIRPGIVHRIDKDTTGLLVVAKNDEAHSKLSKQLSQHTVLRKYQAIVYNSIREETGTVDEPIGRDSKNRLKQGVNGKNSRHAVTHYKVLNRLGRFTHLELKLETGRTHQIRVHMSYIKHPILGDQVYGPKKKNLGIESQMLHAKTLGFIHPSTGEYLEFESPLPKEFEKVLAKLGI